jgi:hypothetical protein
MQGILIESSHWILRFSWNLFKDSQKDTNPSWRVHQEEQGSKNPSDNANECEFISFSSTNVAYEDLQQKPRKS